ncbi:MAG: primosomal protein N' [Gammaproteobacteria bacterium]
MIERQSQPPNRPSARRATQAAPILRIAVPSPVRQCFDYWAPAGAAAESLRPGLRVQVPFRKGTRIGIVIAVADHSAVPPNRLKSVITVLDDNPILPPDTLDLLQWSSRYYHHPIGEVFRAILPALLRRGREPSARKDDWCWQLTKLGASISPSDLQRAPRQAGVLCALQAHPQGMIGNASAAAEPGGRQALLALEKKGWVTRVESDPPTPLPDRKAPWLPEPAQAEVIRAITAVGQRYCPILLEGVTGSGKTEVYLELIDHSVRRGRQALILIPEIGLTPQMLARFQQRLSIRMQVLHSGLSDGERLRAWTMARDGRVSVIIGTRSAAFVPLKNPGIFIVDEEHDISYKQQDGFRYSARDIIVMRARQADVPVVLGSATPSLESLHNVVQGRYRHLLLPTRAGGASAPAVSIIDLRSRTLDASLSEPLLQAIDDRLSRGEQSLLFINRRGYAPLMICHECGWIADCTHCDARLVYHHTAERLRCHHCGAEHAVPERCPTCSSVDLRILGTGTERVVKALNQHFPDAHIGRIDRDTVAHRGALDAALSSVHTGETNILVGTQMLTKGHHFPWVTLVGILDADHGLFGSDFRSTERMGQLIIQVAGRSGRGERPGSVLIQTHHPGHPLLRLLITEGYHSFAKTLLAERSEAALPPYCALALVRAETSARDATIAFLSEAKQRAQARLTDGVAVLGPVPAPMERRGGRYRAQLLIQAPRRGALHRLLHAWVPVLETLKSGRQVRWSVDVDPQVML